MPHLISCLSVFCFISQLPAKYEWQFSRTWREDRTTFFIIFFLNISLFISKIAVWFSRKLFSLFICSFNLKFWKLPESFISYKSMWPWILALFMSPDPPTVSICLLPWWLNCIFPSFKSFWLIKTHSSKNSLFKCYFFLFIINLFMSQPQHLP